MRSSRTEKIGVFRTAHGKANALDTELCEAITVRLEEHRHSSMQALVFIGQGQIFSAGVDLLRVLDGGPAYLEVFLPALSKAFETLFCFPKPSSRQSTGTPSPEAVCWHAPQTTGSWLTRRAESASPELLVGVPFPTVALEIMRCVAAPEQFQALLYSGATLAPENAAQRGLVDAIAEPGNLLDLALAKAESLAALPDAAFELTKRQIHEPMMKRMREDGARFDATVQELWAAPPALAAMRDYVARTFKRSQK